MEQCDVLIVIPLTEEFRTLCEYLEVGEPIRSGASYIYPVKVEKERKILVTCIGEMGNSAASQYATDILSRVTPKLAVLIGIAGRLGKELLLGNVVVATEVNEFMAQSKVVGEDVYRFEYSGNNWRLDKILQSAIQNFEFAEKELYEEWQAKVTDIHKSIPSAYRNELLPVKYTLGHIASGEPVVDSSRYKVELHGIDRKFLAIELEGAGFYRGTTDRPNPVKALVVRGVSDHAQWKEGSDSIGEGALRRYAMAAATLFLIYLLKSKAFKEYLGGSEEAEESRKGLIRVSNIPQHDTIFVGRKDEIKRAIALLESRFFLVELSGLGGIGKTATAIEVGNFCIDEGLFQGVIWVSAKDETWEISRLLKAIITFEYGFTGEDRPVDEGILLAQRILASSKILLTIDNFDEIRDERLIAFLKQVPSPSKVLLTTRSSKIKEATTLKLGGLPAEDCLTLARNEAKRLSLDPTVVTEHDLLSLPEVTFGIPFLIKWVVGRLKLGHSYTEIATALKRHGPEATQVYDYVFKKTFSELDNVSLQALLTLALSKNALDVDFLVGVVDPSASGVVREKLDLLVGQNLVDVDGTSLGVYKLHPLTQDYILSFAASSTVLKPAKERFYAFVREHAIYSGNSDSPAFPFITRNFYTVLSVLDYYIAHDLWKESVSLEQGISRYLWLKGFWKYRVDYGQKALGMAKKTNDSKSVIRILMDDIGWTSYVLYKDPSNASKYVEEARTLAIQTKDQYSRVKSMRHLAAMARDSGDLPTAKSRYSEALGLVDKIENDRERTEMKASFNLSLAKLVRQEGGYQNALRYVNDAIKLFGTIKDEPRLLKARNFRAEVLSFLDIDEAIKEYQYVLEFAQALRLDQTPLALEGLYECFMKKGEKEQARRYLEQAIDGYEALGSATDANRLRRKL
jgi:nucleoside phosphorylase/tetratricopeptide (TPR) repeat protein